jgi:hypothetical protein
MNATHAAACASSFQPGSSVKATARNRDSEGEVCGGATGVMVQAAASAATAAAAA